MATQSKMKMQARQTRLRATPRALTPTCHTAATKVWIARSCSGKLYISGVSQVMTLGEETHEDDQGDSEFTNLSDKALCRAIEPCRDDPIVSPPDIEHTTNCLQKIEYEKRELSRKFNEPSKWQQESCQADHIDVGRPLK